MAYRNDVDALEARYQALEAELAEKVRARDEVAQMLDEARARDRAEQQLARRALRRRYRMYAIGPAIFAVIATLTAIGAHRHRSGLDMDEVLHVFSGFADRMCECTTQACAERVSDDMTHWAQEMSKQLPPAPKMDDATMRRATEIGQRMGECMSKAMAPPAANAP